MAKPQRDEKGIAILVTLFAVMIMTFLALEIGYNTQVEFRIGASQLDRLKAYYLAKSGVQFSLLRIQVYNTAQSRFGAQLGSAKGALDLIWQFPFSWPPLLPPEMSSFDKDNIDKSVKKSFIEGAFSTSIESEGGKIDVNDLGSTIEGLRKAVNAQLVQMIQNRLDQDDDWAQEHRGIIRPQEIVNNIEDWIDADSDSLNGGAESGYYVNTEPPIVPPNRPIKTIEELHMVKGVTDEVYKIIAPRLTVYGTKGINVNTASSDVLQSIDKVITKDVAQAMIDRRTDQTLGPFKDINDLTTFLNSKQVNTTNFNKTTPLPLFFDSEYNFRIKSTGIYRHAQREIVAIVYDFDKVKAQLAAQLPSAAPTPTSGGGAPPPPPAASPTPSPSAAQGGTQSGPPHIIFWQEF